MLLSLPPEILFMVTDYLPQREILSFRLVNSFLSALVAPRVFSDLILGYRYDVVAERILNLRKHGLTRHVHRLLISPLVFPLPPPAHDTEQSPFDFQLLSGLLHDCADKLTELTVTRFDGRPAHLARTLSAELLWHLTHRRMPSLRSLRLCVPCSRTVAEIFGGDRLRRSSDGLFPGLERLDLRIGTKNEYMQGYEYVKDTLAMLTLGCKDLKDLRVSVFTRGAVFAPLDTTNIQPIDFNTVGFDVSKLRTFCLDFALILPQVKPIVDLLRPMRNLRQLRLRDIAWEIRADKERWTNWSDVFKLVEDEMTGLLAYEFDGLRTYTRPFSPGEPGLTGNPGGEMPNSEELMSSLKVEIDALESLMVAVRRRRMGLGMSEWQTNPKERNVNFGGNGLPCPCPF